MSKGKKKGKKELSPEEENMIAEAKAKMVNIFGGKVPLGRAKLTVTFKDGTKKSYDITP